MATERGVVELVSNQEDKTTTLNDQAQSLEDLIAAETSLTITGDTALTVEQQIATHFVLGGSPGAGFTLQLNATSLKFSVENNTGQICTVQVGAGPAGTTATVAAGATRLLWCDGTDVVYQEGLGAGSNSEVLEYALSDEATALTTGVGKLTSRAPFAGTLTAVRASLTTASSSGVVTVDVNIGGSTVLSTKLTIDASEKTSVTAATAAVISSSSITDDDEITFDIDTAGTNATGLKVRLYITPS